MKTTHPFIYLLFFVSFLAGATEFPTVEEFHFNTLGFRSLEQILDDGYLAVIAKPSSRTDEAFRGAYLIQGTSEEEDVILLSPYELPPNPFGLDYYRTAQTVAGTSDGTEFWCISQDQTAKTGHFPYLHYYTDGMEAKTESLASQIDEIYQNIFLSNQGSAILYGGRSASKFGTLEKEVFTQVGQDFTLPDNTVLKPAVTEDLTSIFYVATSESGVRTVKLSIYDLESGNAIDLEDIGDREKLGIFVGEWLSEQHVVSCTADGGILVYRYIGDEGLTLRVATRISDGVYSYQTLNDISGATAPAISSNGKFIAYRKENRIYRYDLSKNDWTVLSPETQTLTNVQPFISPSGRFVAYLDDENVLWRIDCGAAIGPMEEEIRCNLESTVELPIEVSGATKDTTLSWSLAGSGSLPGKIVTSDGKTVIQQGKAYALSTLPWKFQSSSECGTAELCFVTDGYSRNLVITTADFENLTAEVPSKNYVCKFSNMDFTDATTLYVETNVWGNSLDAMTPWKYDFVQKAWTEVEKKDTPAEGLISADGATKAWVSTEGKLLISFRYNTEDEVGPVEYAEGVSAVYGLSQDGKQVIYKTTGGDFYGAVSTDKQSSFRLTAIPKTAGNVVLSANGRYVMWTAGTPAALYRTKVNILKKTTGSAECLTPNIVKFNVLGVAVAPSAKYLAVSSGADLENGGKTIAQNNNVNLYQWTDENWKNSSPAFTSGQSYIANKNVSTKFELSMSDADADALIPKIGTAPAHGTAKIIAPCPEQPSYLLSYTPTKNFAGKDEMTLTLSDGTTETNASVVISINNPPEWSANNPPAEMTMPALATKSVKLVATDVDGNALKYSLGEGAPSWSKVSGSQLILQPEVVNQGETTLTVLASDGIAEPVPKTITVTVTAGNATITAGVLWGAVTPQSSPTTFSQAAEKDLAGCWKDFAGSWHAMSLPGSTEIGALCTALGCDSIYLYQDGAFQAVSTGTLPAGTGFWAKPAFNNTKATITLTPDDGPAEERFIGPAWLDVDIPENLYQVEDKVWRKTTKWEYGLGYFR